MRTKKIDADFLIEAYRHGYFPMADPVSGEISWYSPDPRAVIPFELFHVSRSLRQVIARGEFDVRIDTCFKDVIQACADRKETWISREIIRVYCDLHAQNFAHSVESWKRGNLVGGLYGVAIGGAFFGESMFSRVPNASSVALVRLVHHLREQGFQLLDSQISNPHMTRFGSLEIPRMEYQTRLRRALGVVTSFNRSL